MTHRTVEAENLETFTLLWLNQSPIDAKERLELEHELRAVINYLLIFEDEPSFLEYIQSRTKSDRLILLIESKLAQQLIPQIIHLPHISGIYVHGNEQQYPEQWAKYAKKIRIIDGQWSDLIKRLQLDQTEREMYHLGELLPTNIFYSTKTDQNVLLSSGNTHFLHTQKLIHHLAYIQPVLTNERNELIHRCLQQYQNNPKELHTVEEFDKTYSADQSMRWYTRHSFLYRLLNKALRMQHLDMILLLRFFVYDLAQALNTKKQASSTSSVRLYRAQGLSKKELETWMKSVGELISINTFLWVSPERDQSRSKLTLSDDLEPVLFEIDADLRSNQGKVFPNVTKDDETFFMIGSIFRLVCIERDTDGIWIVQLALCSERDHSLQEIFHSISHHLVDAKTDSLSLGFLLEEMNKLDDAMRYFDRFLQHLPKDHEDIARCYHARGEITQKQGHFDSSLKWFKKSLELDTKFLNKNDPTIATGHNSIAVVYSKKGDYARALDSFKKALEIWKKSLGEEDLEVAMCLNNIGIIYQEQKKYPEALEFYQKAWSIRQNILPVEHPSLGQSHFCLGNAHYYLIHYDLALEHFKLSLEISRRSLFPHHPSIALILRNIAMVYQRKGEGKQALAYMKQAATLFRQSVPSTNPDLMQIERILLRMTAK